MQRERKVLQSVTGLILALAMILVILITSYSSIGGSMGIIRFYRKEYDKYDVYSEARIWNRKKS